MSLTLRTSNEGKSIIHLPVNHFLCMPRSIFHSMPLGEQGVHNLHNNLLLFALNELLKKK